MLSARAAAVRPLTKIFLAEIERLLCAAAGATSDADALPSARPRLGAASFLHRFGSALNHHVHLHVCATDGVFVPAAAEAGCDVPPAFRPAHPITQVHLAALAERVSRRMIRAVTALALGNVGKRGDAAAGGHASDDHATGGCCDAIHANQKPRSHDTSRIAWANLRARMGEEFPLHCPGCGGDIRLIAFFTDPGRIRKILPHLREPLAPPPLSPARGPPTDWGELVQSHADRDAIQTSPDELPVIDIHLL